ncbi:MAG: diacylglycerol kinase family protein [Planctomycetota bacterium]
MPDVVLILANPFSGKGPNRKRVDRLERTLSDAGLSPKVVWEREARTPALAELGEDGRCVVAAGGDGSVADVLNDMRAAGRLDLPFATLPCGNENLFAQAFGFSGEPEAIARAIARGETVPCDLGQAGERLFTLMVSAGFDAEVVRRLDRWRTRTRNGSLKRVDRLRYAPRILGTILGYRFAAVTLEADGRTIEGHQAYVFNLPQYGGGFRFAPDARPDDGVFDWVVFQKPGFLRLLLYHWRVVRGRHLGSSGVAHGQASAVTLHTADGVYLPTQADGDPAGATPLRVSVLPAAIRVIQGGTRG